MPRTTALLVGALFAAGCAAAPTSASPPAGTADVEVVATDMQFTPDRIEVTGGEPLTIHLANDGGTVHDLVLESGWESGPVDPGQSVLVPLESLPGTTVAWCSVPGHRQAGMELELVVAD